MTIEEIQDNLSNGNFRDVAEEVIRKKDSLVSLLDEMIDSSYASIECRDLLIVSDIIIDIERDNKMILEQSDNIKDIYEEI